MIKNDNDWVHVYSSAYPHKVNIVKAVLADNSIKSVEVNKQDSVYIMIGDIELYVHRDDELLASFLIKKNKL